MKLRRNILVAVLGLYLVSNASIEVASGNVHKRLYQRNSVIEICKLIKNPSEYAGKTIRLKAVLVENQNTLVDGGDPYLYGPDCRKTDFTVLVDWSSQESYQPLETIREKPDVNGYVRRNVILVGVFHYSGVEKYGHLDWAKAQFVVNRVEKAKATAARIPWPRWSEL